LLVGSTYIGPTDQPQTLQECCVGHVVTLLDSNNGDSAFWQCLYGCSQEESPLAIQSLLQHLPADEGGMTAATATK